MLGGVMAVLQEVACATCQHSAMSSDVILSTSDIHVRAMRPYLVTCCLRGRPPMTLKIAFCRVPTPSSFLTRREIVLSRKTKKI